MGTQMANIRYFNDLTADFVEDFLFDLSYQCLGTSERKFLGICGSMFERLWDKMLKQKLGLVFGPLAV